MSNVKLFGIISVALSFACSSGEDMPTSGDQSIGHSSAAITVVKSTSSSRGHDGVEQEGRPLNYGLPNGTVPDGGSAPDPGMCFFTHLEGSFRGKNEWARIGVDATGRIAPFTLSQTIYTDHTPNVGPIATIGCVFLSDLGATPGQVGTFNGGFDFGRTAFSGHFFGGADTYESVNNTPEAWGSLSTVNGHLRAVDGQSDMARVDNTSSGNLFSARLSDFPVNCVVSQDECSLTDSILYVHSTVPLNFTHIVGHTNQNISGIADTVLTPSAATICMINGIGGNWDVNSSADISDPGDGQWHLKLHWGTGTGGSQPVVTAIVDCLPAAQGW